MLKYIWELFFPRKCALCEKLLRKNETDLCHSCRQNTPEFQKSKNKHSFIARWTAVWYYKDKVRESILRYKFLGNLSCVCVYGRFTAIKLQQEGLDDFDLLTWVPVSRQRKNKRGFDQVELLAKQVGKELSVKPVRALIKTRNNPPQSSIVGSAARRANVLNAYRVTDPALVMGKRILLLDDVITTGATASECARTLLTAGAKEVIFAAIATADHDK